MKVGLVLSGGGARGFAHLGVIKGLLEQGFRFDVISGVSAGAVAGALYAQGHSPDEILRIFLTTRLFKFIRPSTSLKGFFRADRLETLCRQYLPHDSFEGLGLPLCVNATDIAAGETVFFSQGPLIRPLLASGAIPVLFEPVNIGGRQLVDGGLLNNLPVEPLLGRCDFIIGVHTNPCAPGRPLRNVRNIMERTLLLAIHNNVPERARQCHLYLEPPALCQYTTLDNAKARDIFDIGYAYTLESAPRIAETYARHLEAFKASL
jgi:NTE family protein